MIIGEGVARLEGADIKKGLLNRVDNGDDGHENEYDKESDGQREGGDEGEANGIEILESESREKTKTTAEEAKAETDAMMQIEKMNIEIKMRPRMGMKV
jgi:hypothetical protein